MADAARKPGMTVDVVTETEALLDLRLEWQHLYETADAEIFMAWDWQLSWWRHLGGSRQLFVLVARDAGGCARGLLPLSLETVRVGLRRLHRLRFMGDDRVGSDYLDALIEPGWDKAVVPAFARLLTARNPSWDLLELRDMDEHSSTARRLCDALGDGYKLHSTPGLMCPAGDLNPEQSPEEFLSQCGRSDNYARRRKWLTSQPDFRIDLCRDPTKLAPALNDFFRLHRLRWAKAGGSLGIVGAAVETFHREALMALSSSGHVRLYTLWVQGSAVASVYALTRGKTFYYYQSGMDPAWRSRSVGLVLIGETFSDALRSGFTRYDFLRGEEGYKADWVDGGRRLVSHRLFPRHGSGARAVGDDALLHKGKQFIKRFLPVHMH